MKRKFVDTDYGQIHLRIAGTASRNHPLICLHQSPKSSREFVNFMQVAAADRQGIAIDNPGHGESNIPSGRPHIEDYAKAAWQALGALQLNPPFDLLGHHTGSNVAVEMAYQRPKDVGGLVLISAPILQVDEAKNFKSLFKPIPLDADGTRFKTLWDRAMKYRLPDMSLEQTAFLFAENFRAGEAYEWGHEAAFDYAGRFTQRLESLPHAITILNPQDLLFDYTARASKYLQNGKVIDCPDWSYGFLDTDSLNVFNRVKAALESKAKA